jgi:hypothetical protein
MGIVQNFVQETACFKISLSLAKDTVIFIKDEVKTI